MSKHKKAADSYIPAACFALFLLVIAFLDFKYIMGALIIFPIIALGISAFFSSTRPDKA
jgi:hypothetical protein